MAYFFLTDTQTASADTLKRAVAEVQHQGGGLSGLVNHVFDSHELELPLIGHVSLPEIHLFGIDLSLTKHTFFLLMGACIVTLITVVAARQNKKNKVPKGLGNLVEIVVIFIRDEIVLPSMGSAGLRYLPYILTVFFFILTMNLLGMIPYSASATGNVNVTAVLAAISFIMIQYSSIRAQGLAHYLKHFTGGAPWWMWFITIPIEVLGIFTKPVALCIRLFANMTAGHIAIISIIGLIFLFKNYFVVPVPIALALGVSLLELFVAFLQAYVFTILTALFMGFGIQAGHSHEQH